MSQTLIPRFGQQRKKITVSPDRLVSEHPLVTHQKPGIVIQAELPQLSSADWLKQNLDRFDALLNQHGAVLLRGFQPVGVTDFKPLIESIDAPPLAYQNRSTPRSEVSDGVFTSTDYPEDESIPQHNEMAYTRSWPKRLYFNCVVEPGEGGQTPIANSANVYNRLPETLRTRFEQHGVMYVRNYRPGMDIPWQQVFQTDDKAEVARYCDSHQIEHQWLNDHWLRTRQVCQASIRHHLNDRMLWFNQAHLFHVSNLPENTRQELCKTFADNELPRNACFGHGQPIDEADLKLIRQAYTEEEAVFDWQHGDIFVIDNEAVTHGRRPFKQPRQIVVAMT